MLPLMLFGFGNFSKWAKIIMVLWTIFIGIAMFDTEMKKRAELEVHKEVR